MTHRSVCDHQAARLCTHYRPRAHLWQPHLSIDLAAYKYYRFIFYRSSGARQNLAASASDAAAATLLLLLLHA